MSRVVAVRQDMEEALAKNVEGQTDTRSQLMAMRKDMDAQSQNITLSVGQITKMGAQLLDFKREVHDLKSKQIEVQMAQVTAPREDTEVDSQGQLSNLAAQLLDLRREVEDLRFNQSEVPSSQLSTLQKDMEISSKSAEGKMSNLVAQLLELRRDVKDLQSNQTEGHLSQMTALQKDMEVHSVNAAGQMSNMAAQLLDLRRDVQDVQSKQTGGGLAQMSTMAAQLLDLRREVEDMQSKQNEGSDSFCRTTTPRKTDTDYYSQYVTIEKHAADVEALRQIFGDKAQEAGQNNDLAVEALANLQSRLKGASSVIGSFSAHNDEKLGSYSCTQDFEQNLAPSMGSSGSEPDVSVQSSTQAGLGTSYSGTASAPTSQLVGASLASSVASKDEKSQPQNKSWRGLWRAS